MMIQLNKLAKMEFDSDLRPTRPGIPCALLIRTLTSRRSSNGWVFSESSWSRYASSLINSQIVIRWSTKCSHPLSKKIVDPLATANGFVWEWILEPLENITIFEFFSEVMKKWSKVKRTMESLETIMTLIIFQRLWKMIKNLHIFKWLHH